MPSEVAIQTLPADSNASRQLSEVVRQLKETVVIAFLVLCRNLFHSRDDQHLNRHLAPFDAQAHFF